MLVRYDYTCDSCGITQEFVVKGPKARKKCGECGKAMRREFPRPNLVGMPFIGGRYDVNTGKHFESYKHYDAYCRQNSITPVSKTDKKPNFAPKKNSDLSPTQMERLKAKMNKWGV